MVISTSYREGEWSTLCSTFKIREDTGMRREGEREIEIERGIEKEWRNVEQIERENFLHACLTQYSTVQYYIEYGL